MRGSSVIFVGGFTLIFGFFANQSFRADSRAIQTADVRASFLQADLIALSGQYMATYYMATPSSTDGYIVTGRACNSGTLDYTITVLTSDGLGPKTVQISTTGTVGTVSVQKVGIATRGVAGYVNYSWWSQWALSRVYTRPYSLANVVVD